MTETSELPKLQDTFRNDISREEFEGFIAEVESFRDTILDEFTKLKQDMEKMKYQMELVEEALKDKDIKIGSSQRKL
jgi:hypothetical protein